MAGTDETGLKINGQKCWTWTWQNDKLTYIAQSNNRGFATIQTNFEDGFVKSVLVHDYFLGHCNMLNVNKTSKFCNFFFLFHLILICRFQNLRLRLLFCFLVAIFRFRIISKTNLVSLCNFRHELECLLECQLAK